MGTGEGRGKKRNSRETEDRLCPAELIEISKKKVIVLSKKMTVL